MTKPTFRFEKKLWRRGFKFVAGADEVGRGCFAGCVAAAVVVFTRASLDIFAAPDVPRIDDSKKLTKMLMILQRRKGKLRILLPTKNTARSGSSREL